MFRFIKKIGAKNAKIFPWLDCGWTVAYQKFTEPSISE